MFREEIESGLKNLGFQRFDRGGFFKLATGSFELNDEDISRITLGYTVNESPINIIYLCGFRDGRREEHGEVSRFFKKYMH